MSARKVIDREVLEEMAEGGMSINGAAAALRSSRKAVKREADRLGVVLSIGGKKQWLPIQHLRAEIEDMKPIEAVEALLHVVEEIIGAREVDGLDGLLKEHLTPKPRALLAFLLANEGHAISRDQALAALYMHDADTPNEKIIDVFVCKIRAAVTDEVQIETIWGRGWRARRVTA